MHNLYFLHFTPFPFIMSITPSLTPSLTPSSLPHSLLFHYILMFTPQGLCPCILSGPQTRPTQNEVVYNTLLELYLMEWSTCVGKEEKVVKEKKALELLKKSDVSTRSSSLPPLLPPLPTLILSSTSSPPHSHPSPTLLPPLPTLILSPPSSLSTLAPPQPSFASLLLWLQQ